MIEVTKATLVIGNEETICETFSKDTREITKGSVYVGIKGENIDGSLLYEEALKKGASVCLLETVSIPEEIKEKYADRAILLVEDSIKALQEIATYKRELYDIPVIAVTGSVGKTSTKDMVASVVGQKYNVLKTMGNYNNHIGVPLTILRLKEENALVVEMGMNAIGEIEVLSKIAKPTIAIITNVGTAHIGKLGSRENILKAKLEITAGLQEQGILVINNDNDLLHSWNTSKGTSWVKTFGIEQTSDVMGSQIDQKEEGSSFLVTIGKEESKIEVPIGGMPFVYNALCAITVGKLLGIAMEDMVKGIKEIELTKNRMEIMKNRNGVTIISDCYNANYDSVKAGLEYLANTKANRKIAILGDMLELGEFSKELHEKVGEAVVENKTDYLVTVGIEAKRIAQVAIQNGMPKENVKEMKTTQEAVLVVKALLQEGDIVLVKASNGMHFNTIVEAIK